MYTELRLLSGQGRLSSFLAPYSILYFDFSEGTMKVPPEGPVCLQFRDCAMSMIIVKLFYCFPLFYSINLAEVSSRAVCKNTSSALFTAGSRQSTNNFVITSGLDPLVGTHEKTMWENRKGHDKSKTTIG